MTTPVPPPAIAPGDRPAGNIRSTRSAAVGRHGMIATSQALASAAGLKALHEGGVTVPAALSLMVFFALCAQCVSTLAVIGRETRSWEWPVFTFVYMTVLAYVAAFVVFQVATFLGA